MTRSGERPRRKRKRDPPHSNLPTPRLGSASDGSPKTLAPAQRPRIGHKSVIAVKFVDREEQIEQAA